MLASARPANAQLAWAVAQAIPSPEIVRDQRQQSTGEERDTRFGLRWQVTPFLWSWGLHRRAPQRWRVLRVEPTFRQTGSTELWLSPEWLHDGGWIGRGGVRTYFPIWQRGEYVSASVASAAWTDGHRVGPAFEVGLYALAGFLGLELGVATARDRTLTNLTFKVRVL